VIRIRFKQKEDEIKGYYLLATHGWVKTLKGGIYEINEELRKLLDQKKIPYEKVNLNFAIAKFTLRTARRDGLG